MTRQVHPSVEEMLHPAALAQALSRPVRSVARRLVAVKGWGSTDPVFEGVSLDGESTASLIVKHMYQSTDWEAISIGVATDRQVAIWESGVLDRLPDAIGHAVVSAARFDGGCALLMRNLDEHFLADDTDVSTECATDVLRGLAAMHATFWQDPPTADLGGGMCDLGRWLSMVSPAMLAELAQVLPGMEVVVGISGAWQQLPNLVDSGAVRDLRALADDPARAVAALSAYPTTLLHGDVRMANVAWDGTRATLVDWKPIAGPPGIDLIYFVSMLDEFSPFHPDEAAVLYRQMLEDTVGDVGSWWDEHLDVCFAAVLAAIAGPKAWGLERYDPQRHPEWVAMRWWADRAQRGMRIIAQA